MDNQQLEHKQYQPQLGKYPVCLLLNDFDSPANVGSIFRIADAFNLEKILLTGTSPIPPNRKMMRTSRATEKSVPYSRYENALEIINQLKSEDYKIVCLEITSSSIDIRQASFSNKDKICLILGSENVGIAPQLLALSDETIHIPMVGQNSSINVATACAITIFEIIRTYLPG